MLTRSAEPAGNPVASAEPLYQTMSVPREVSMPCARMSSLGSTATTERSPRSASMRVQMPVPAPISAASIVDAARST